MSASLVGSEMCIRDRRNHYTAVQRAISDRFRTTKPELAGDGLGLELRPVSYTHLTLPTICSV
eukprot:6544324-Alexandrium_andersonii.AAC.1